MTYDKKSGDDHSPNLPPSSGEQLAALRILDANFNRVSEGLRVVEEYCRFALEDRHLAQTAKEIRHDIGKLTAGISPETLAKARETLRDVGTGVTLGSEKTRAGILDVVIASTKRIEQSLRAIEEYAKLGYPQLSAAAKQLRYRAYTLARAMLLTDHHRQQMAKRQLYVLIDGQASDGEFASLVRMLVEARVDVLQLRDKRLTDRQLLEKAQLLKSLVEQFAPAGAEETAERPLLVMNDRPDLALLARLDGVHVGQDELPVDAARKIVGPEMLVGVSTHSIEQARQAVLDGASYIGCGPVFPSNTKQFGSFVGTEFLAQVAAEIQLPAFAIGGITLENLPQVTAAGFTRVAVSAAVSSAADPATAARLLKTELIAAAARQA